MGKLTRSQKKGKVSSYTSRFLKNRIKFSNYLPFQEMSKLKLDRFRTMPKSNAVIMECFYNGRKLYYAAPLGAQKGSSFNTEEVNSIIVKPLSEFNVNDVVCNIEIKKGSHKFICRAAGAWAKIVQMTSSFVTLEVGLRKITFPSKYMAMKGIVNNGGSKLKPLVKAGNASKMRYALGKKYPIVSSHKMNVQENVGGGSYRKSRGRAMTCARNKSPGSKYGSIAAKRTGRKKK